METWIALLVVAIILIVVLKIHSSFKTSAQPYIIPLAASLEWFELQICPYDFRFAVLPQQPILIGWQRENSDDNLLWLMSREDYPDAFRSIINSLDSLIKSSRVLETEPHEPETTFEEGAMNMPSMHLRIGYGTDGYGTGYRWQTCYDITEIPDKFLSFLEGCRKLALGIIEANPGRDVSDHEAWELTHVKRTPDQLFNAPDAVIAKIKITKEGDIILDGKAVTLDELGMKLERVRRQEGIVWYHREHPPNEPGEKASAQIGAVIEIINELGLYAELCEQDFE